MSGIFYLGVFFVVFGTFNLFAALRARKKGETVSVEKYTFKVNVIKGKQAKEMWRGVDIFSAFIIFVGVLICVLAFIG